MTRHSLRRHFYDGVAMVMIWMVVGFVAAIVITIRKIREAWNVAGMDRDIYVDRARHHDTHMGD